MKRLDLPTFGRPRMATPISSATRSSRAAPSMPASRSTMTSSRSPVLCAVQGGDRDRDRRGRARRAPPRRSLALRVVEPCWRPRSPASARGGGSSRPPGRRGRCRPARRRRTAIRSASATRLRACSATWRAIGPSASTSMPPVSTSGSRSPFHSQPRPPCGRASRPAVSCTTVSRAAPEAVDERRLADVREADDGDGAGDAARRLAGLGASRLAAGARLRSRRRSAYARLIDRLHGGRDTGGTASRGRPFASVARTNSRRRAQLFLDRLSDDRYARAPRRTPDTSIGVPHATVAGCSGLRPCWSVPTMHAGRIGARSAIASIAAPVRASPISSRSWRVPSTKMPSSSPAFSTRRAAAIASRSALPRSTGNAPVCGSMRRTTGIDQNSTFAM